MIQMFETLLKYLADKQATIQGKEHDMIVGLLLNEMRAFFMLIDSQPGRFITSNPLFLSPKNEEKSKSPPRPNQSTEVNEIIVKIEMKKFQNLIENRIKHKNNLLQADAKRLYPMNKLMTKGFTAFEEKRRSSQGNKSTVRDASLESNEDEPIEQYSQSMPQS